jgi:hypothetical protein
MIQLPLLPLLIKEKVEFYYNRQVWLINTKIMHKEYNDRVKITNSYYENYVTWRVYDKENTVEVDKIICYISDSIYENLYFIPRLYIRQFKYHSNNSQYIWTRLPKRYVYTSGLNDPSGYK